MDDFWCRLVGGGVAAGSVALAAHWRRALSVDGAAAAFVTGTVIVAGGGWWWGVLLVIFFVTSSALSRWHAPAAGLTVRGSRRDAVQVLANGGVPVMLAAVAGVAPGVIDRLLFPAFAGAVAAATADTWATEIGAGSRRPPWLITSLRPVPPGTSGGVTVWGTFGSLAGALVIGGLAAFGVARGWVAVEVGTWSLAAVVTVAGFAAAVVDSLLGATVQAGYVCPRCQRPTEQPVHGCGTPSRLVRGLPFVTNDVVNGIASVSGALVAGLGAALVS